MKTEESATIINDLVKIWRDIIRNHAGRRSVRGIVSCRQQIGTASASHARGARDKSRVNVPPIAAYSHHGAQSEGYPCHHTRIL
jgi:hypothetical protein